MGRIFSVIFLLGQFPFSVFALDQVQIQKMGVDVVGPRISVHSADDFEGIKQISNWQNAVISIENDIQFDERALSPIGGCDSVAFKGVLNGNGHTLSYPILWSQECVGLFGTLEGAVVRNLKIFRPEARFGTVQGFGGILASKATKGTVIRNVHIESAKIKLGASYLGGLVGLLDSSEIIASSYDGGELNTAAGSGGLVGKAVDSVFKKISLIGTSSHRNIYDEVGGLTYEAIRCDFIDIDLEVTAKDIVAKFFEDSTLTKVSAQLGGSRLKALIGTASGELSITDVHVNANFDFAYDATDAVGGFIRFANQSNLNIQSSSFNGTFSMRSNGFEYGENNFSIGGMIGEANRSQINIFDSTSKIKASKFECKSCGGMIGNSRYSDLLIFNSEGSLEVDACTYCGGLVGELYLRGSHPTKGSAGFFKVRGKAQTSGEGTTSFKHYDTGGLVGRVTGISYGPAHNGGAQVLAIQDSIGENISRGCYRGCGGVLGFLDIEAIEYAPTLNADHYDSGVRIQRTRGIHSANFGGGVGGVVGVIGSTPGLFIKETQGSVELVRTETISPSEEKLYAVGGLIGRSDQNQWGNPLSINFSSGLIEVASPKGDESTSQFGGLIGYAKPYAASIFEIQNSSGEVRGQFAEVGGRVGGLIGIADASNGSSIKLSKSRARLNLEFLGAANVVGGIFGTASGRVVLTDSLAEGEVQGPQAETLGGLAGYAVHTGAEEARIERSISRLRLWPRSTKKYKLEENTGLLGESSGGIMGRPIFLAYYWNGFPAYQLEHYDHLPVVNSYWDQEWGYIGHNWGGGEGKLSAELLDSQILVGYDFENVWAQPNAAEGTKISLKNVATYVESDE